MDMSDDNKKSRLDDLAEAAGGAKRAAAQNQSRQIELLEAIHAELQSLREIITTLAARTGSE